MNYQIKDSDTLILAFCLLKKMFVFQECAEKGEDYDRVKLLEITADDAERWERKKKKKNPDTGFAGWWQGNDL